MAMEDNYWRTPAGRILIGVSVVVIIVVGIWMALYPPSPMQIQEQAPEAEVATVQTQGGPFQQQNPPAPPLPWIRETRTISISNALQSFVYVCPFQEGTEPELIQYTFFGKWNASKAEHTLYRHGPNGNEDEWTVGSQGEVPIRFVCKSDTENKTGNTVVGAFKEGTFSPYRELHPGRPQPK